MRKLERAVSAWAIRLALGANGAQQEGQEALKAA